MKKNRAIFTNMTPEKISKEGYNAMQDAHPSIIISKRPILFPEYAGKYMGLEKHLEDIGVERCDGVSICCLDKPREGGELKYSVMYGGVLSESQNIYVITPLEKIK